MARGHACWHTHLKLLVGSLDLLDTHRPGGLCDARPPVDLCPRALARAWAARTMSP